MRICYCGEPTEAERYNLCKKCWWNEDPRNPVNAKPKKMFRVEIVEILQYTCEFKAEDEATARFMVDYERVEPKNCNSSIDRYQIIELEKK